MITLALPAFVASAASTLSLQSDILVDCAFSDDNYLHSYTVNLVDAVWRRA